MEHYLVNLNFFFLLLFFSLAYNCFTVFCQFLLYNEVNQLYVYLYPFPLGPSCHPPSHPSRLSQSTRLSSLCYTAGSHQLFYTWQSIYVKPNLPVHPTLLFPPCPHVHSLCLHLYSCPANRFICAIFLDSTYIRQYTIFVFLFLAYFTLYDRLQVHPHLYK